MTKVFCKNLWINAHEVNHFQIGWFTSWFSVRFRTKCAWFTPWAVHSIGILYTLLTMISDRNFNTDSADRIFQKKKRSAHGDFNSRLMISLIGDWPCTVWGLHHTHCVWNLTEIPNPRSAFRCFIFLAFLHFGFLFFFRLAGNTFSFFFVCSQIHFFLVYCCTSFFFFFPKCGSLFFFHLVT